MDSENMDSPGEANLPSTAGSRLRAAREAAGLSRSDIASQTKIAERHLIAIEEDRFGDLAARTYAVGFSRAYARALGLDESEIAEAVHSQLDTAERDDIESPQSFEPGDPARVPPLRLAWIAGGAIIVIAILWLFGSHYLSPQGTLPDLLPSETATPAASASPAPIAPQPVPAKGPIVLTATDNNVWLRVTDASGAKLLEKYLRKGESWTVPADAKAPKLRTGRPDALQVTVGGQAIPPLATYAKTISGVSLAATDLLSRGKPGDAAGAAPAVKPTAQPTRRSAATPQQPTPTPSPTATPRTQAIHTPTVAPARPAGKPTAASSPKPAVSPSSRPMPSPTPTATRTVKPPATATATPIVESIPTANATTGTSPTPASATVPPSTSSSEPVSTDSE